MAAALRVPPHLMLGLHEHLRYSTPYRTDTEFQATVIGEESAGDALRRFANALNAVMRGNPQEHLAVVAHGTVSSLWVAAANGAEATGLRQTLKFLDLGSLDWPALKLRSREPLA